jgi:hypothetical protein
VTPGATLTINVGKGGAGFGASGAGASGVVRLVWGPSVSFPSNASSTTNETYN